MQQKSAEIILELQLARRMNDPERPAAMSLQIIASPNCYSSQRQAVLEEFLNSITLESSL